MREEIGDLPTSWPTPTRCGTSPRRSSGCATSRRSGCAGSRSRPAPTTCSATPRSAAPSRPSASPPASTAANRVMFKQLLQAERHRLLPDRRLPPRRGQRGARGAAAGGQVRRAGVPARRRARPVRVRAAPLGHRLRVRQRLARRPHDRVRRPPARALRASGASCATVATSCRRARVLGRDAARVAAPRSRFPGAEWRRADARSVPTRPLGLGGDRADRQPVRARVRRRRRAGDGRRGVGRRASASSTPRRSTGTALSERRLGARCATGPATSSCSRPRSGGCCGRGAGRAQTIFTDVDDVAPRVRLLADGDRAVARGEPGAARHSIASTCARARSRRPRGRTRSPARSRRCCGCATRA